MTAQSKNPKKCLRNRATISQQPVYNSWKSAKQRCYDKRCKDYPRYGGRGIAMWEPWRQEFNLFYLFMGDPPGKGYQLDRINNDGNYEPGNCRWVDSKTQSNNRRTNVSITAFGKTQSIEHWAKETGIKYATIWNRYHRLKLTPEQAVYAEKYAPGKYMKEVCKKVTHNGLLLSVADWAKELGISVGAAYKRLRKQNK